MNGTWRLIACTPDRQQLGVLTGWTLDLTLRYNKVGSWSIGIPPERTPVGWPAPGSRVVFVRNDQIVASGQWDDRTWRWSADPSSADAASGKYTLTGDTDLGRLAYHIVYPTPGQPWDSQVNNHWVYPLGGVTDNAEEVARVTINWQAGSLALDAAPQPRQVPGLRLGTDNGLGSQTVIRERFTPLLEALRKVLEPDNLRMDIVDALDGNMDFTVQATVDRTGRAIFGVEVGNVTEMMVRDIAPITTAAMIGGPGEKAARELVEILDAQADVDAWGRRETFVDQRQVSTENEDGTPNTLPDRMKEYEKAAAEQFVDDRAQTAVSVTVIDTPQVQWGRDYGLGDLVSATTPHGLVTSRIGEVRIEVDATGVETITSTIGAPESSTGNPLARSVRSLQKRISQIERGL